MLDQAAKHSAHPVEVLAAAVHRDLRPRRDGEPLSRHAEGLGELQGAEQQAALGLCDRPERLCRVTQHRDPRHPLRVPHRRCGDDPHHHARLVAPGRAAHGHEAPLAVQVVLGERAVRPGQHRDELVGVGSSPPLRLDDLSGVLVQRLHRCGGRVVQAHAEPRPGLLAQPNHQLPHAGRSARVGHTAVHEDLVEAEAFGDRSQAAGDGQELVDRCLDQR
ncbi:MAG: hypothetical protein AVDCRST_MAG76-395 [uncultured Acidimicrobiales bacterium]|uniref:Uncharacterized protein n=1 Tax=uncultured Acidimicrobiales bacterium TaxID=310071 RepID=A0A6J4H7C9_9ACTN|nr:MAG: hypothetical protein AVDCRST_MAG76-395 [uncultured Acidimicrobiales bacterium]